MVQDIDTYSGIPNKEHHKWVYGTVDLSLKPLFTWSTWKVHMDCASCLSRSRYHIGAHVSDAKGDDWLLCEIALSCVSFPMLFTPIGFFVSMEASLTSANCSTFRITPLIGKSIKS